MAAGFDESRVTFDVFDNAISNRFEPFSLINELLRTTCEPYLIVCHQDVRMTLEGTAGKLEQCIAELDRLDPAWAIAGPAGTTDDFEFIVRVRDPNDFPQTDGRLPAKVNSLDECFLLFRIGSRIRCSSPELSGFHLYGTDACLNARQRGGSAWVIDFPIEHLSSGSFDESFFACRRKFVEHWNSAFDFAWCIRGHEVFLSRWSLLRRLGPKVRLRRSLMRWPILRRLMTRQLDRQPS